jgi:hypothetical protein
MARHGAVKIPIYKAILVNPVFTVAQICDWTGLTKTQVYWTLSDLQKRGVLTTANAPAVDKPLPYRPALIYRLSDNPEKRRILSDAVAPFVNLEGKDHRGAQQAYAIARSKLDDIGARLLSLMATSVSSTTLDRAKELLSSLEDVRSRYEAAWSKAPSLRSQIRPDLTRWKDYQKRLAELVINGRDESSATAARREFSSLVDVVWSEVLSGAMDSGTLNGRVREVYNYATHISVRNNLARMAALLNSKLAMYETEPSHAWSEILTSIAECALRFGEPSFGSLDYVTAIREALGDDLVTQYNFANLSLLMGKQEDALQGWHSVLDLAVESLAETNKLWSFRNAVLSNAPYESTLVLLTDEDNIRPEVLGRLEDELRLEGAISIVSASPVKRFEGQPYVLTPTLLSWDSEAYQALRLLHAEQKDQILYVYGPLEDAVRFPGTPVLRVATGLVGLGMSRPRAWDLAFKLRQQMRLLLVHGLRGLDLGRVGEALPPFREREEITVTPAAPGSRLRAAAIAAASYR